MLGLSRVVSYGNYPLVGYNSQNKGLNYEPLYKQKEMFLLPHSTLQPYDDISFGSYLNVKFTPPKGKKFMLSPVINEEFQAAQIKLIEQAKNPDFWVNLPAKLLKEKVTDRVYKTVEEFKKPFEGKNPKLIFVGLGNPANAEEASKALNLGHKIVYCCEISQPEVKQAIMDAGGNLDAIQVLISSKSGTTFESNETYKLLVEEFTKHYKNKGIPEKNIQQEISKHFLCLTDKSPSAKLKREALEKGYKTIDCVDNLPSGFGDLAYNLPLLAYAGLPKEDMIKMLQATKKMSIKLLNSPLNNNMAGKMAAYDSFAKKSEASNELFRFFGRAVDFTHTIKQLYKESLRLVGFDAGVYPRAAHEALEADLSRQLSGQPVKVVTNVRTKYKGKSDSMTALETSHVKNAKNEGHYQKDLLFKLDEDGCRVAPQALGQFYMLKSYLAYFKNEFEHLNQNLYNISYVKRYKDDFAKRMAKLDK